MFKSKFEKLGTITKTRNIYKTPNGKFSATISDLDSNGSSGESKSHFYNVNPKIDF